MAEESARTSAKPAHYAFVILVMSFLVVTGALGFGRFGYPMILPFMKTGLGLTYTQTGLLDTANFVGYLSFALLGGILAAKYGPRLLVGVGLVAAGASMFGTGLAPTLGVAVIARAITGMGSGASNVPVMGLVSSWFAPSRRGLASGVVVGGSGFGLVISGPLIPFIVSSSGSEGWRYAWCMLGILTFLLGPFAYVFLRNRPAEKGLAPLGLPARPITGPAPSAAKASWREVLHSPVLWELGTLFLFFGFSYVVYTTFFSAYLTREVGLTPSIAGTIWALVGLLSLASGVIWGSLSDWIGRRLGLVVVFLLQSLSFAVFSLPGHIVAIYASAVLFGLSAWAIPAIVGAAAGDYLGARRVAAAMGLITLFFGCGQALSPVIAGAIADATHSFSLAYLVAAAAAVAGAAVSLLLKPPTYPA